VLDLDAAQARRSRREPLDHLCELAAAIEPGADGLSLLPAQDESERNHLLGLSGEHGKGHLVRAALEGAALEVALGLRHAAGQEFACRRLFTWGPGAAAPLWNQIVADATGHEVAAVNAPDLCARGAAVMAYAASVANIELAQASVRLALPAQRYAPRGPSRAAYAERLEQLPGLRAALAHCPPGDGMETSWVGASSSTES
jgi:sugar (pentulose or hexulose) kinase